MLASGKLVIEKRVKPYQLEIFVNFRNAFAFLLFISRFVLFASIDSGIMQFGASLSRISMCILSCWPKENNDKMHELILENASTNRTVAGANSITVQPLENGYLERAPTNLSQAPTHSCTVKQTYHPTVNRCPNWHFK